MTHERSAIACPQCSKRYAIPPGSIGPEGRTVRCVSCHHAWTAVPDDVFIVARRPAAPDDSSSTVEATTQEPTVPERVAAVDTVEPPRSVPYERTAPAQDVEIPHRDDPTAHLETVGDTETDAHRPRRRFKLLTALGALVAVTAAGGAGMIALQQAPVTTASPKLIIRIPDRPVRQRTADGQEVITTTARVANEGTVPGRVPELRATMRTPDGRVVREWRVSPPAGDIAPRNTRDVPIGTSGDSVPQGPLTLDVDMIERDGR